MTTTVLELSKYDARVLRTFRSWAVLHRAVPAGYDYREVSLADAIGGRPAALVKVIKAALAAGAEWQVREDVIFDRDAEGNAVRLYAYSVTVWFNGETFEHSWDEAGRMRTYNSTPVKRTLAALTA